jgi:hypothetical protein
MRTNMVLILSHTALRAQRRAMQCGDCDMKGEIRNPKIVTGTQKYVYT